MATIGIYRILSPENGVYVGQSINIEQRFRQHKNKATRKHRLLRASFDKYGYSSHVFTILHELPSDVGQDVLDRYEEYYIQLHKDAGYIIFNLRGAGHNGKHSEESIKLMVGKNGKWMTGRKLSPESIAKRTLKQKGVKRSRAVKDAISARMKGEKNHRYGKYKDVK